MGKINDIIKQCLIFLIRIYRYLLSPFVGQNCRFHPTCSCYAIDALELFGLFYGCYLTLHRLLRCQPWSQGGIDPVPERKKQC